MLTVGAPSPARCFLFNADSRRGRRSYTLVSEPLLVIQMYIYNKIKLDQFACSAAPPTPASCVALSASATSGGM